MLPCHDARSRIPSGTHSTAAEYQAIWVKSSIWAAFNENLCGKKAFISRGLILHFGGSIGDYHPKLLCDKHLWRDFLRSRHLL